MRFSRTFILGAIAIALLSGALLAQDIPLNNWTVPPYTASASRGGITTMTDATPPRVFVGAQPCRVTDTRGNGAPIQGGIFANGESRTWDVTNICGIPAGADAISANFTVTGSPAAPPGAFILAWPTGGPVPPVSILNFQAGQTIANAAIVPLGAGEQLNVNVSHSTHVLMDVNGYFSDFLNNPQNALVLNNNSTDVVIAANNSSTTCSGSCGIQAITSSGYALYGNALDTLGTAYGVYGEINTLTTNSAAMRGFSDASTGITYGVWGQNDSVSNQSAGVRGTTGPSLPGGSVWQNAGVRGEGSHLANSIGTLGLAENHGVVGVLINSAGTTLVYGTLGTNFGTDPGGGGPNWAVFGQGDIGASGLKFFVDPHPTDPSKVIGYISLEGPEAGTYFRGRARFQNGMATIEVPEHFRLVTDPEGLTVQVTPIGGMATVGVLRADLNEIVVQSSRNLEFSYLVQGVRATFKHTNVIWEDGQFRPRSGGESLPAYFSEGQRARLIANGTYRADGTVNMETAQRLGWDKIWAEREHPTIQPGDNP